MILKEFTSVANLPNANSFYGFAKVPSFGGTQNIFYSDGSTWWMLGGAKGDITSVSYNSEGRLQSWVEGGIAFARTFDAADRTLTVTYDGKTANFQYDASNNFLGIQIT